VTPVALLLRAGVLLGSLVLTLTTVLASADVPWVGLVAEWVVLLVATLLVVLQHLGAAWAAAVPPGAAVPPALLRMWARRLGAVSGVATAVWGIAWVAASRPSGEAAALTVLACVLLLTAGAAWWRLEQRS
jgi:hypothetical protein